MPTAMILTTRIAFYLFLKEAANGLRYPLVGGTRQRHFAGTNSKPRKLPENAQTPTSRVHAVLGVANCCSNLMSTDMMKNFQMHYRCELTDYTFLLEHGLSRQNIRLKS